MSELERWMTVTVPPRASGTLSARRRRYHPMTESAKMRATAPIDLMGTRGGLALHSAPATHPASPSLRSASPNPPALWLRWAKPTSANASRS
jgi:hypothetical protein